MCRNRLKLYNELNGNSSFYQPGRQGLKPQSARVMVACRDVPALRSACFLCDVRHGHQCLTVSNDEAGRAPQTPRYHFSPRSPGATLPRSTDTQLALGNEGLEKLLLCVCALPCLYVLLIPPIAKRWNLPCMREICWKCKLRHVSQGWALEHVSRTG